MSATDEKWPASPADAQAYLDQHPGGSGDPEKLEAAEEFLASLGKRSPTPAPGGGGLKNSAFPKPPEDLLEERGAD